MKFGNNGNLVLSPFDQSTPCLMMVLMNYQTKLRINHLTAVKSTFSALANAKPKGRCILDGGANKSFLLREVVELLDLKVVDKEALVIYTFGGEAAEKRTYDIVEITLQNVQTNKHIKIQAVVIDSITSARIRIPSKFIRNIALERRIELANNSTFERIHVLIGSDYISEILENEEFNFGRVKKLWSLETIGINPNNEVPLSDKEILKSFEQNTVYTIKKYETRLLWKEGRRELKNNYEIAKRRLLGLSKAFEKNEELCLKYDEIIKEHLRDGIIERVKRRFLGNCGDLERSLRSKRDETVKKMSQKISGKVPYRFVTIPPKRKRDLFEGHKQPENKLRNQFLALIYSPDDFTLYIYQSDTKKTPSLRERKQLRPKTTL
ncbi:uncharacterized protein TNCV_2178971 [Trichonephila clavipes]|uniref:Peptidase aspartic putative domain-containing protein n=1 Tax=Trichonephila clavipes TaxID=2585209 RepID=A0A8X7B7X1_TRICX|nr:uncharacterized protein TNCV_2178971 [Trichonephila clavipes]